ncbi:SDR family NAD(P)-dependent oxidoreductase [Novosphingobium sp. JCM 18896]|uniref:SDR family NAD(P)-dependent oxidoreductase n=1 Tax=Novosphingobium sp. JCM 18896 TaxID=2989731 RepID=UPI002221F2A8|nr:glucose 1-dehydrogenase [Novosphingobium sp. JCM 18896]MCW1428677.1 glucose 1-dehydrogenase [Novosphingobium sp. JCM 18896]
MALMDEFSLEGRVAVVTGAAAGIGRQAAQTFAEAGAKLVIGDVDEAGLAETARLIGSAATTLHTDVSRKADIDALAAKALELHGRIDVWANVAGTAGPCPFLDVTEDLLEKVVAINLKGVFWGSQAAARAMKETGGGSIINISSTGAISAPPGMSVYAMTKSGVSAITRNVAKEMGAFGIRANTVSPGFVETTLATWSYRKPDGSLDEAKREEALRLRRGAAPLGIIGEPSDIAYAMLYLASEASRFVSGQNLYVNGGVTMG